MPVFSAHPRAGGCRKCSTAGRTFTGLNRPARLPAGSWFLKECSFMPQTINTNVASLNAQRNLNTSQILAGHLDGAAVLGPARQLRQGRRRRPGHRRPHERADPRHERRDPQCQRRHLAGADGRRRAGHDDRRAAAHARTGGAGAERLQRHQRPRQPGHRIPGSWRSKSAASPRRPSSTAPPSSAPAPARRSSRWVPTAATR